MRSQRGTLRPMRTASREFTVVWTLVYFMSRLLAFTKAIAYVANKYYNNYE